MVVTPSKLREDIYNLLDRVLESGEVLEVKRKGKIIKIVPPQKNGSKLQRLTAHPDAVVGESDDLVRIDWSSEWKPFI